MRNLIRTPLTWLVVAEFIVVGALMAVTWNVVGGAARGGLGSPLAAIPAPATDDPSPLPDIPGPSLPGSHGPLPGLNLSSAFWRQRLEELNRDQTLFVQLEWRVIHAAMDAMQRYLETVVLPAVRAAEGVVP
jgi:hypothetical protein